VSEVTGPPCAVGATAPIVALDFPTAAAALAMVDRLGGSCDFYKVGNELFTAAGPAIVHALRDRGADVFLDLKFHDIPNTVAGGVRSAATLGARLVTVHASGGREMLEAAVAAAAESGGNCTVLGVTVLTSLDARAVAAAWGRGELDVREEVLRLAEEVAASGAHGIVCSGQEAAAVRERFGDRLALLVPGVRPVGGDVGDQARVVTPAAAARAGARWIVVGRPVTASPDPTATMRGIRRELADAVGAHA
jgi:orotidine-5'-phosphate decarboxylase